VSRPSAQESVERLLAMVPWIAAQPGGVTVAEACERFGISRARLEADLGMLGLVSIAPHTPDMYLEVYLDDEVIDIRPQWLDRPLNLTASQGLALVVAGGSLTEVSGADPNGPLVRALAKLAAALGIEPGHDLDVDLGRASPQVMATLTAAVDNPRQVRITYYSASQDSLDERVVEPWSVFSAEGAWYADAWCHHAGGFRRFRLDRISEAVGTDLPATEPVEAAYADVETSAYRPPGDAPRVTIELDPGVAWAVDRWSCEAVEPLDDGGVRVTLAVGGPAWAERAVVQLGDRMRVVDDPDGVFNGLAARTAERILARYRTTSATSG